MGDDDNFEFEEMSCQEKQFFDMSGEFMEVGNGINTTQLILKYSSESFQCLLDRCMVKKNSISDQVEIELQMKMNNSEIKFINTKNVSINISFK